MCFDKQNPESHFSDPRNACRETWKQLQTGGTCQGTSLSPTHKAHSGSHQRGSFIYQPQEKTFPGSGGKAQNSTSAADTAICQSQLSFWQEESKTQEPWGFWVFLCLQEPNSPKGCWDIQPRNKWAVPTDGPWIEGQKIFPRFWRQWWRLIQLVGRLCLTNTVYYSPRALLRIRIKIKLDTTACSLSALGNGDPSFGGKKTPNNQNPKLKASTPPTNFQVRNHKWP